MNREGWMKLLSIYWQLRKSENGEMNMALAILCSNFPAKFDHQHKCMNTNRYYIKATGSVCYDSTGIIFPSQIALDFTSLLSQLKNAEMKWENQFGWKNQPLVLTFKATEKEARAVNDRLPLGLIVSEYWEE